jgi:hypothetical protein
VRQTDAERSQRRRVRERIAEIADVVSRLPNASVSDPRTVLDPTVPLADLRRIARRAEVDVQRCNGDELTELVGTTEVLYDAASTRRFDALDLALAIYARSWPKIDKPTEVRLLRLAALVRREQGRSAATWFARRVAFIDEGSVDHVLAMHDHLIVVRSNADVRAVEGAMRDTFNALQFVPRLDGPYEWRATVAATIASQLLHARLDLDASSEEIIRDARAWAERLGEVPVAQAWVPSFERIYYSALSRKLSRGMDRRTRPPAATRRAVADAFQTCDGLYGTSDAPVWRLQWQLERVRVSLAAETRSSPYSGTLGELVDPATSELQRFAEMRPEHVSFPSEDRAFARYRHQAQRVAR